MDIFVMILKEFGPNIAMGGLLFFWMDRNNKEMQARVDKRDDILLQIVRDDTTATAAQANATTALKDAVMDIREIVQTLVNEFKVIRRTMK